MELKTFDAVVEKALLAFYECFPTPIQIDPNIVGLSEEEPNRSDMNKPLHSVEWNKLADEVDRAILWLHEEGYLHGSEKNLRFTLSSKGFSLLAQMNDVVVPRMLRG